MRAPTPAPLSSLPGPSMAASPPMSLPGSRSRSPSRSLLLLVLSLPLASARPAPFLGAGTAPVPVVDLWGGDMPDAVSARGPERTLPSPRLDSTQVEVTEPTVLVTDVSRPTISIHSPPREKDTGAAVIICPGGGYWNLYWQLEGQEVAAWLSSLGVTGVILKYRVPRRPGEVESEPALRPLQDAQRAVSLVRSRAGEWGIDPRRIGMVGFSAGGHLVVATATGFEERAYPPTDAVDRVSCRPDFAIVVYPGYLKVKDRAELAPGIHVPADTPPVFLAHGGDDLISSPEHSVLFYLALKRAGISAELHVYAGARHDFAVRDVGHPCSGWTESCRQWLRHQGFLESGTKGQQEDQEKDKQKVENKSQNEDKDRGEKEEP